ncbi:hypothetical protein GPECTOR_7g1328 [Gonium pectorale]|uniref:Uncharacterized protein n=1 Tax=Gonium pectorale TaxID=33097 RepID=A0A150GVQ3_GONPE|nr:hypothetical protein GPECTOR_7g1328 [Gonium pectorale]|eukprot:KXZ53430.1 hypothetical protein GPECTOR_7g1328 [Gonium pectorale]
MPNSARSVAPKPLPSAASFDTGAAGAHHAIALGSPAAGDAAASASAAAIASGGSGGRPRHAHKTLEDKIAEEAARAEATPAVGSWHQLPVAAQNAVGPVGGHGIGIGMGVAHLAQNAMAFIAGHSLGLHVEPGGAAEPHAAPGKRAHAGGAYLRGPVRRALRTRTAAARRR